MTSERTAYLMAIAAGDLGDVLERMVERSIKRNHDYFGLEDSLRSKPRDGSGNAAGGNPLPTNK